MTLSDLTCPYCQTTGFDYHFPTDIGSADYDMLECWNCHRAFAVATDTT
jgi:hypothetical protein